MSDEGMREKATRPQWGWVCWLALQMVYLLSVMYRKADRILARMGASSMDGLPEEFANTLDREPDASLGPILTCADAPGLFELLDRLSRKLGCRIPGEVRLTYLPMCGVLEMPVHEVYSRQVLVIGLPCLHIWSKYELKAALAHELAHLVHRDATFTRDVLEFVVHLRARLATTRKRRWLRPRCLLAWAFVHVAGSMAAYVSRMMEFRADDWSAQRYGSAALSAALEKLAVVQPVFREILSLADRADANNVYRVFARVWTGLNGEGYQRLRDRLLEASRAERFDHHPPVALRLERLQTLRRGRRREFFPSLHLLDDPRLLERLLHNRLYRVHANKPSVFRPHLLPAARVAEPAITLGFV